jgi:hypothetical protein
MNIIDSLHLVLGRIDKWEIDTLNCACTVAKLEHSVKFSSRLHRNAKAYMVSNSPWVKQTTWKGIETPDWIIHRVQEWPGAHGDLPGFTTYTFKAGDTEYSCFCKYSNYPYSEYGGNLESVSCSARTVLSGYESMPVSSPSNVVSVCHCPHWTPPDKIAALLVSSKLADSKMAAVAIFNDEICTHAALAFQ